MLLLACGWIVINLLNFTNVVKALHRDLSSVILASFGVTTGPVFCGVIGHEERHEYTVIGQKVSVALVMSVSKSHSNL